MRPIALHIVPYGRPAALLLRERIAAVKNGDPLQPVSVVVPTNYVAVSTRRLLASGELGRITTRGAGLAGLTLLTVTRLAELLGGPRLAAQGRRPQSSPLIAAAVRQVLADEPGIFLPVREHPSTEEALVRAYRELSELRPDSLDALAATGVRGREVVRIRRAVRARLEAEWFEEADLMAAAERTMTAGSPSLDTLGVVLVYLPQDLSLPAAGLLRGVARKTPMEVIAGRTGPKRADADVDRALRRLGLVPPAATAIVPPAATAIVSVSDAEEEVRSAVQRVLAAAGRGIPLERAAVLYPSPEPYARIVAEQFDAAGIAWNGRAVRPPADRVLGRWLLDLLGLPDTRYARPAVMGLISGAPLVGENGRWVPGGAWERISREAGVVRERGEWKAKLARLAGDLRHRADAEEAGDEPREWLVNRLRRNAAQADGLRGFVSELFDRLAAAGNLSGWSEFVGWCQGMIRRYLGDERERDRWPEIERAAAERVDEALDRLAGLDHVERGVDLRVFRRTLQHELDDDLGRIGEFGEGALVGTPGTALGVDLDLVVVLGLAEGVFPTRPREDSLLPDLERQAMRDELRPRAESVGVEHRHLLTSLAASGGERVLTYPRGDLRRSTERAPSRWLLDAAGALRGEGGAGTERSLPARAEWLETVPSFARRVRTVPFPATRQEYGLRALAGAEGKARGRLRTHPLVNADDALRRGVDLALSRGRAGFTRFDGNLAHLAEHLPSPTDPRRVVSPSQLETWLTCPHAYLMQYVLRVEPVENPEQVLEIDAVEKGGLIHDVLERWLGEQLAAALPRPFEPWSADARARLRELAETACDDAERRGVTGHALLWNRDRRRIVLDLERFVDHDDDRRASSGLTPCGAEHPFGMPTGTSGPIRIDLGDGRIVEVRGRIDRIDTAIDGGVTVVDYKTGSTYNYRELGDAQPLGDGSRLQLAIYGLAAQAAHPHASRVRSEYWFVSTRGEFKRIGYELTDEIEAHLRQALRVAIDGITAGHFPMRPPEPGWRRFTECRFCDPDDLGTADRYRDWERIRQAGQLRGYVSYMEPDLLGPDGKAEGVQA
ncbi:MAG: hypothetical protein GEU81_05615 [Nitriliruptorales bacterium]|nr:hypothetical protein [Nitriliruptorales bacterium]